MQYGRRFIILLFLMKQSISNRLILRNAEFLTLPIDAIKILLYKKEV